MSEAACILLMLMRYVNRNPQCNLQGVLPELIHVLCITPPELHDIQQSLKDDIRAMNADYLAYERVNEILKKF